MKPQAMANGHALLSRGATRKTVQLGAVVVVVVASGNIRRIKIIVSNQIITLTLPTPRHVDESNVKSA